MAVVGCGEPPSSQEAAGPAGAAPSGASAPAEPAAPPPLPRPTDPAAFVGRHVLVPDGATLHLGPEAGAATVTLRLPPAASEHAPTPAAAMRVVAHEGGRLALQPAAPELGCVPPLSGLASFDVRVWVEPAALARVLGRAVEARFPDGTSVKLRPGVPVGPPGERVEVSADGLRLAVPIAEGDVSTLYAAEPAPAVPTGLRALEPGAPLVYAGGDPVLPESALVGGGLVLAQRTDGDRTLVRVASRCAEVEAVVEPTRLAPQRPGAAAAPEGRDAIEGPPRQSMLARGATWTVEPGKALTWPGGAAAGTTTARHTFSVEPTAHGNHLCFGVAPTEAAVAEHERLPLCLLAADVARRDPLAIAGSAGMLGLLAPSPGGAASPFGVEDPVAERLADDLVEAYGGVGVMGTIESGRGMGEGTLGLGSPGSGGSAVPPSPSGKASVGVVKASGLPVASAQEVVAKRRSQLRYCHERQLLTNPGLSGALELSLEVASGSVTRATATGETLPAELLRCVERSAKRWRFEGTGSITVPVTFTVGD